jgi:hypothetical protein
MATSRGDLAGQDLMRRLEEREALAYGRLMRHCDRCGRCHLARATGRLLQLRALCSCGRLLAGAWDRPGPRPPPSTSSCGRHRDGAVNAGVDPKGATVLGAVVAGLGLNGGGSCPVGVDEGDSPGGLGGSRP